MQISRDLDGAGRRARVLTPGFTVLAWVGFPFCAGLHSEFYREVCSQHECVHKSLSPHWVQMPAYLSVHAEIGTNIGAHRVQSQAPEFRHQEPVRSLLLEQFKVHPVLMVVSLSARACAGHSKTGGGGHTTPTSSNCRLWPLTSGKTLKPQEPRWLTRSSFQKV